MSALSLKSVPAFPLVYDAGDGIILALEALFRYRGRRRSVAWLAGISGDAFKFVYDRGDVFEPLRDRVPVDTATLAAQAVGLKGRWLLDASRPQVIEAVAHSLARGYPVLAPYLAPEVHSAALIVGLDRAAGTFDLQVPRPDPNADAPYVTIPIPDRWDGPVPGPAIWADTPLFLIEGEGSPPDEGVLLREALERAVALAQGGSLPYKPHPGAQEYSVPPLTGRYAFHGRDALDLLQYEVGQVMPNRFAVIWRMDAQLGQLAWDRANAAAFLRQAAEMTPEMTAALTEAARLYEETARLARRAKGAYWDQGLLEVTEAEAALAYLRESSSMVYALPPAATAWEEVTRRLWRLETPWGPAAILVTPDRVAAIQETVDGIVRNERRVGELLGGNVRREA